MLELCLWAPSHRATSLVLPVTGAGAQGTLAAPEVPEAQRPRDLPHHMHVEWMILKNAPPGVSQVYCEMEFLHKKRSLCGSQAWSWYTDSTNHGQSSPLLSWTYRAATKVCFKRTEIGGNCARSHSHSCVWERYSKTSVDYETERCKDKATHRGLHPKMAWHAKVTAFHRSLPSCSIGDTTLEAALEPWRCTSLSQTVCHHPPEIKPQPWAG